MTLKLQKACDEVTRITTENEMKLNSLKCKELIINFRKNFKTENIPSIVVDGNVLQRVNCAKLLLVIWNSSLTWEDHTDSLYKRTISQFFLLLQMKRSGLSDKNLLFMYMSTIRPMISYAAPIWFPGLNVDQQNSSERLQKRAMRIIFGYNITYYDILSQNNISTLGYLESICVNYVKQICDTPGHPLRSLLPASKI